MWHPFDDRQLSAGIEECGRGLQTDGSAADDDHVLRLLQALAQTPAVLQRDQRHDARQMSPWHRGHERLRARGDHEPVVGDPLAFVRDQGFPVQVNCGNGGGSPHVQAQVLEDLRPVDDQAVEAIDLAVQDERHAALAVGDRGVFRKNDELRVRGPAGDVECGRQAGATRAQEHNPVS